MGFMPRYQGEGRAFAKNILATQPDAKIGILYQNDDFGRDVLKGFKDQLGEKASMIVKEIPYESTDPTIDGQILQIHSAGANVFMSMTTPKFAAQAIRKITELEWWQSAMLEASEVNVTMTPCKHWGARMFKDMHRHYGGYVLADGTHSVYHSGDTAYFQGFREIGRLLQPQVALLPIGAYFPDSYRAVHTSPEEGLRAFLDLGTATTMPATPQNQPPNHTARNTRMGFRSNRRPTRSGCTICPSIVANAR